MIAGLSVLVDCTEVRGTLACLLPTPHGDLSMADTSRRSSVKRDVLIAVAAVVAGSLLTVLLDHCLQRAYPTVSDVRIRSGVALLSEEAPFHLNTLRKDYPPFVLKKELVSTRDAYRTGFLRLERVPPMWWYRISIANLTAADLTTVDVTIHFKGVAKAVGVHPLSASCHLRLGPTAVLPWDEVTMIPNSEDPFTVAVSALGSGESSVFILVILAEKRPSLDSVEIRAQCAEGKFEELTPVQWERIGWTKR